MFTPISASTSVMLDYIIFTDADLVGGGGGVEGLIL